MASFCKPEACGQTMLPDRSILIGQKLMEIAKIEELKNSNETFFGNFQTMCRGLSSDRIFSLVFKEKLGKLHFSGLNCLD